MNPTILKIMKASLSVSAVVWLSACYNDPILIRSLFCFLGVLVFFFAYGGFDKFIIKAKEPLSGHADPDNQTDRIHEP